MRVRIPGIVPISLVVLAVVASCPSPEPEERDLEARSGVHHEMIGHPPNCLCCRRFDVAKEPMNAEQAEWIDRLTQERIKRLKAAGRLPTHPSKRPAVDRDR